MSLQGTLLIMYSLSPDLYKRRVTDNSVYVAPMVHEFGWSMDDWEKMGAAVTIGHIIECSAGCAGGMSNFWKEVKEQEKNERDKI